jgi:hypothetical protein
MRIRACSAADHDAVVALSLRAWAPAFESVDGVLGEALSKLLHGEDWRVHQAEEVRETLADASHSVWSPSSPSRSSASPQRASSTSHG